MYLNQLKTWEVDLKEKTADLITGIRPISLKNYDLDLYEGWGGLNCDVYNRLWILDSKTNQAIVTLPKELSGLNIIPLDPKISPPYTTYVIKGGDTTATALEVTEEQAMILGLQRSVQAGGDWTGNRWYQKYANGLLEYPIEGTSVPFKIYDLEKSYKVAKVNESWNYADYFKSLAFPEVIQNNESFYEFLQATTGSNTSTENNLGSTIYEKIANFVPNHSDVTTAEINSLHSISKQMGVEVKEYANDYPAEVRRLIDIFSINKHYLMGIPNVETDPTKKIGDLLNPNLTDTVMLTANRFYLLTHKQTNNSRLVFANKLGDLEQFSADLLETDGLLTPLTENYYIFNYDVDAVVEEMPFVNNTIDWNSYLTTLSRNISSTEDWYGDEGVLDTMFNNLLTKQLFGK